jgi:hypothetical protein
MFAEILSGALLVHKAEGNINSIQEKSSNVKELK